MKRTQVQLEEKVWEKLRERAFREHRSISDVVRRFIVREMYIEPNPHEKKNKRFSFVASGASHGKNSGKISKRHDEELAKIYR